MPAITLAISLSEAKNIGIGLVALFLLGSVVAAWLMKTIIQKIATAAVLVVLAFAVFTQRTSLQDCADKVRTVYELRDEAAVPEQPLDTECSFFGTTIGIPDPRTPDPTE
ncbi:MAG: hypothetical protein ABJH68_01160 [Ilumatobacter sp.]|uniref:hypothetical protein n=1 Tax=Ilumatobacter sp. TaxID=1967498 RepID=UPI003298BDF8